MISGIYCIENITDGKKYIGKGSDIKKRWSDHIYLFKNNKHYNSYMQRIWNKYGKNVFKFYIIEECNKNNLVSKEKYYIKKMKTKTPNGYNLTDGGEGMENPSIETRRKISIASGNRHHADETKKKMSILYSGNGNPMFGRKHSRKTKIKMSKNHVDVSGEKNHFFGKPSPKGMLGKHPSNDTIKKLSKSLKGNKNALKKLSLKT